MLIIESIKNFFHKVWFLKLISNNNTQHAKQKENMKEILKKFLLFTMPSSLLDQSMNASIS
jgi:hypothetical protein